MKSNLIPNVKEFFVSQGSKTALIDADTQHEVSYHALYLLSRELVRNLQERRLVFLLASWSINNVSFYLGCLEKQIPVVLLPKNISLQSLKNLIDKFNPSFIQFEERHVAFDLLKFLQSEYKSCKGSRLEYGIQDSSLAILIPTSGSTGSPKFVRISYENITSNTKAICQGLDLDNKSRSITTLPMSYSYGLSVFSTHLACGGSIVLTENSVITRKFWNSLTDYQVESINGVPATYEFICKTARDLFLNARLKFATQAGGALSPKLLDEVISLCNLADIKFFKMYGQTEATARMTILPPKELCDSELSVGYPVSGSTINIIGEHGEIVNKPFETGEIQFVGKNVSLGYAFSLEDLSKGDENYGLLNTGDYGYKDNKGRLYVTGRKDRIIKIDGIRLDLAEIELSFGKANFAIHLVSEDGQLGVFQEEQEWKESSKKLFLNEVQISHTRVRFLYVKPIPRSINGKIDYLNLKRYLRKKDHE